MEWYEIEGPARLDGEIEVQGSKNAALPVMAAALLFSGTSVLRRCPDIADVRTMEEILRSAGVRTSREKDALRLDCANIGSTVIPKGPAEKMRSSVMLLGSMLARCGSVTIACPGGCTIGKRPIDLHIKVLEAMGAQIQAEDGMLRAFCRNLHGVDFTFEKSSVGATENALLAAAGASGTTILRNCAREPEISCLCRFLRRMGVRVEGVGGPVLTVSGPVRHAAGEFVIPADRIAAGTYLLAGAAVRGRVTLTGADPGEMGALLEVYQKMGGQYEYNGGKLRTDSRRICPPECLQVRTGCYPGFPTDLQSPLMAALSALPGLGKIEENIFEDRFRTVGELKKMGADISVSGSTAQVRGRPLKGTDVKAWDLRGGAALVIAGLSAGGITRIYDPQYMERGYEKMEEKIRGLGGKMYKRRRA